jgi:hydrogenase maturation protein HypF
MSGTAALALHVTGIVQGVGFRPFVHNLAREQGLAGWVLNASDGVHCVVEGDPDTVMGFPELLREQAPPMAAIERISCEKIAVEGHLAFQIRLSRTEAGAMTLVSPDIATCAECAAELRDPLDRRHGYPFINCTNCGPRFTIIGDVPYDRPNTTMRDFPMCADCHAEYDDPAHRRFHAQPNACFTCGPRLYLNVTSPTAHAAVAAGIVEPEWTPAAETSPRPHRDPGSEAARSAAILDAVVELLRDGAIVALKGLGGFHLACDASDDRAVERLRERKHRWGKPLAVMVPDVGAARLFCAVNEAEEALLTGTVRPIVLLRRTREAEAGGLPADGVADGLSETGVMLPYTPLHHLLLDRFGGPLVMTSGNLSDEPIATDNAEALTRLGNIADAFLLHDRAIASRYDDSVLRVVDDLVEPVRRARGFAPHPLSLPFSSTPHILAVGPEQKNTFTLLKEGYAFVSQHIGDLENAETLDSLERTVALYEHLFRIKPEVVAHDLHPEYLSTKWAATLDLPKVGVQHHHAHVVSVTAEHGIESPVLGVAFDGTGYGEDGHIWGGEVLLADWRGHERAAHLRYVPMPGGAAAVRRPARMAVGTLHALGLLDHPGAAPLRARLADGEERTLLAMMDNGINCPLTSSMGRLFDTVASLCGVADDARYEGEAAIRLEACADPDTQGAYEFAFMAPEESTGPLLIDPTPVLEAILRDVAAARSPSQVSMRFHRAVVHCIVEMGKRFACDAAQGRVALCGGVFMNRIVLGGARRELAEEDLLPIAHLRLPTNDAAVSYGQAVVARARWTGA